MEALVAAERLRQRLIRPSGVWRRIDAVAEVGSTNAELAAAARVGEPGGRVLVADHQSAGRGRFSRAWVAPPRTSVAISALLRPDAAIPPARWLWLPALTGMAVAEGLRQAAAVPASVKWPNDVLIGGRKVCGILVEKVADAVVIGIGINITLNREQLPVPTATSLRLEGSDASATAVVEAVLARLEVGYRRWTAGADLREPFAGACTSIGRQVRVMISAEEAVVGRATGVDHDGRLLVDHDGTVEAFAAGDVFHLR